MKTVKILVLGVLFFAFSNSQAQLVKFGLKGGVNFPSINTLDNNISFDRKNGWHVGGTVLLNIPIVKVGADLLYSQNTFDANTGLSADDLKTGSFDIPVFAKLNFLKILSIHAGPQFSFLTNAKFQDLSIKNEWEHRTVRFIAGVGVNLGPLDLHGRFIFPSKTEWYQTGGELKNSNIQVSLAYYVGGKKKK